jgi:hypothetical protein
MSVGGNDGAVGGAVFGGGGLEAAGGAGEVVGEDAELAGPAAPQGLEPVGEGGVADRGPDPADGREQGPDHRADLVGAGLEPAGGSFQLARDHQQLGHPPHLSASSRKLA